MSKKCYVKLEDDFRDYDSKNAKVEETYKKNHQYQTVEFVNKQLEKYCINFNHKMSIWDAIEMLDKIVDESDPDLDLPQIYHAFQVAENLAEKFPDIEWMPLVGLMHDLGKILSLNFGGKKKLEQWAVVGDIFPVGCKFSDKIVYSEYFKYNKDNSNPKYNTKYGIYKPKCGLDKLLMSFGHDTYMYFVCKHNKCLIPEEGLRIIRYHSFYVMHQENEYEYFMKEEDYKTRELCKTFSMCDLYSKDNNNIINIEELKVKYKKLISKYFPNDVLEW
jgi:inositol oxygenase